MGKYKSKKYLKKKVLKRRTRKYRKNKRGGHEHEDLPHYHLSVKYPNGKIIEMVEQFERSNLERMVDAGTIEDIKTTVRYELNKDGINKPFTLFWRGKKLEDSNVKLRQIVVDKKKLPLYRPNIDDPIVVVLNEDIGDPIYYEAHDLDLEDLRAPQTPR